MLNHRLKYLQIAFNRSLPEIRQMIDLLPGSDRILLEAGTPLIKMYGVKGIAFLKDCWQAKLQSPAYVVADLKCMDRGSTEVEAASQAGASAATCLGLAPVETIIEFIDKCEKAKIDSMIDMMNIRFPFEVLQKLPKLPQVIVLHRGADENDMNREKQIPLYQINRIKSAYNVLISTAGGESLRAATSSFFNNADITVVWRQFYETPEQTAQLAKQFLELIK